MTLALVQGLGSLLTLLAFVWLAAKRDPFRTVTSALRAAYATRGGRRAMAAIGAVLLVNYVEGACDPALTRRLGWDLTRAIHAIEGDLVARLQAATPRALVVPLAVAYVPGYLAILAAPLALWTSAEDHRVAGRYVIAFVINYAIAFPFFLLAPVREVAWSGLSTARPLLETVWPGISEELRAGSPVDNSFPSMHVSCVVTTLWYVHAHGPARLRILAWVVVPIVVWSTLALGIHWVADVAFGVLVGVGACVAADRTP
jgi:membrane-associated phospholipid phosphatase